MIVVVFTFVARCFFQNEHTNLYKNIYNPANAIDRYCFEFKFSFSSNQVYFILSSSRIPLHFFTGIIIFLFLLLKRKIPKSFNISLMLRPINNKCSVVFHSVYFILENSDCPSVFPPVKHSVIIVRPISSSLNKLKPLTHSFTHTKQIHSYTYVFISNNIHMYLSCVSDFVLKLIR